MDSFARRFREWVILLGYTGVGVGFVGLIFISYLLVKNLVDYFTQETIVAGASIVYPGMRVPGLGVLPFWDWIIAIFIIAVVHEFSHGIVAKAHNLEVKNTGIVFFGPILGAFVEPDENKMRKQGDITQYSILAAGSFANIILAIAALILLVVAITPLQSAIVEETGFTFDKYVNEELPFAKAGIKPGMIITGIDEITTKNFQEFQQELLTKKPGEQIKIKTKEREYQIALASNPENKQRPFLGIEEIRNEVEIKSEYRTTGGLLVHKIITRLSSFLRWLFLLSSGIGIFNLLPLPIVDGGRMAQVFLYQLKGPEKGERRYRQISLLFLAILILNIVLPFVLKLL